MDVIYARQGACTAREIEEAMPGAPTNATVRTLLRVLVEKGHVEQSVEGKAFLYRASQPAGSAARTALRRLVDVFFGGSVEQTVSSLLGLERERLTPDELARLADLIHEAKASISSPTATSSPETRKTLKP
jgi:BlaI family transcriptional regulator, penicillinase repressor